MGAHNVQLLSSITKKGRPGYVLLIDMTVKIRSEIEELLLAEFNITGWHYLTSHHCYRTVQQSEKNLNLYINKEMIINKTIPFKTVSNNGATTVILEHDFCVMLKEEIEKQSGYFISLEKLKTRLKNILLSDQSEVLL